MGLEGGAPAASFPRARAVFAALWLGAVALVWAGAYIARETVRDGAEAGLRKRTDAMALVLEANVSRTLDSVAARLMSLDLFDRESKAMPSGRDLEAMVREDTVLRSVSLIDANGRVVLSSTPANLGAVVPPQALAPSVLPRPGDVVYGGVLPVRDLHEMADGRAAADAQVWLVSTQSGVAQGGPRWVAAVNVGFFENLWARLEDEEAKAIALFDYKRAVLVAMNLPASLRDAIASPLIKAAETRERGGFEVDQGQGWRVSYRASPSHPVILVVAGDRQRLWATLEPQMRNLALAAGTASLLVTAVIGLVYVGYRRYEREQRVRANMSRLEEELESARKLQLGMLPGASEARPAWLPVQIEAFIEPAREVGGDLYDDFVLGERRLCVLVGDVSGKGAAAAMFMARVRSLVRVSAELLTEWRGEALSPAMLAEVVNRELCRNNADRMFVTAVIGLLEVDSGRLRFVNAGHPAPYRLLANGGVQRLQSRPDRPLGVSMKSRYTEVAEILQPGDGLYLFSDGVTDATNARNELFGEVRLERELARAAGGTPSEVISGVKAALKLFGAEGRLADDVTMLALRWSPPAPKDSNTASAAPGIDITIGKDVQETARVADLFEDFAWRHGLTDAVRVDLQVCLDELLSNVIRHAFDDDGDQSIRVVARLEEGAVVIEVSEDGRPFDPASFEHTDAQEARREGRAAGLGLYFLRRLVDDIRYERIGATNRVVVRRRIAFDLGAEALGA